MVDVRILQEMYMHYQDNLQKYIQVHPGEYVLLEQDTGRIKEAFFKTEKELEKAFKKYNGLYGPTFYHGKIPVKTHRFNPGNIMLEFVDEHVTICPNDGETRLAAGSSVIVTHIDGNKTYEEKACCPDCRYEVFRRPSKRVIEKLEKHSKEMIFRSKSDETLEDRI